jgi:hypothetical protein
MSTLPIAPALPALTHADRCDRCSARALVRVLLPAGELLFCGHHARAHEERLSYSPGSTWCASSASCPVTSTPVGPAPTTTKVRCALFSFSSVASSASS